MIYFNKASLLANSNQILQLIGNLCSYNSILEKYLNINNCILKSYPVQSKTYNVQQLTKPFISKYSCSKYNSFNIKPTSARYIKTLKQTIFHRSVRIRGVMVGTTIVKLQVFGNFILHCQIFDQTSTIGLGTPQGQSKIKKATTVILKLKKTFETPLKRFRSRALVCVNGLWIFDTKK